jgi:dolichyl-phosphate beta-glucosyltransferase
VQEKTCIIIPCYNEELRLKKNVFTNFLEKEESIHICFTNDGSADKTIQVLNEIKDKHPDKIFIIDLKTNVGKAEAVRLSCMQLSEQQNQFDYIGYFDADLATPLNQIRLLIEGFNKKKDAVLIMGSRVRRLGTSINRNPIRHYLGRIFATCVSILLNIPVYDSQCGAKILRASAINDIFKEPFISKWIFDVEILMRIKKVYGREKINQYIFEVPV